MPVLRKNISDQKDEFSPYLVSTVWHSSTIAYVTGMYGSSARRLILGRRINTSRAEAHLYFGARVGLSAREGELRFMCPHGTYIISKHNNPKAHQLREPLTRLLATDMGYPYLPVMTNVAELLSFLVS